MRVGVVRERKEGERRVALTPRGAGELCAAGHKVLVESGAGDGAGFADDEYARAGACVTESAGPIWKTSELLLKVKEPEGEEYELLHPGLALFAYLHLAPNAELVNALVGAGATAIAYETVEDDDGALPLLAPMSEIAGRLAAQAAAYFLQAPVGGPGVLAGGAAGVAPARVAILGGGIVGVNAARVAAGLGADVTILESSPQRLRELDERLGGSARVLASDSAALDECLHAADAVIGAVLVRGATTPKLVTREMLGLLKPRSVVVDVAIDQGGCFETSRPTTPLDPTYPVDDILHYCVANMPGTVPVTATRALTNATFPYVRRLTDLGVARALEADAGFARGLNARAGRLTNGAG
jgi:alanine dehydrogenase